MRRGQKLMGHTFDYAGRRKRELKVFFLLAALLAPVVTVVTVGSYGFAIWMYQLAAGPPGPDSEASTGRVPTEQIRKR